MDWEVSGPQAIAGDAQANGQSCRFPLSKNLSTKLTAHVVWPSSEPNPSPSTSFSPDEDKDVVSLLAADDTVGKKRLRITPTPFHTEAHMHSLIDALLAVGSELGWTAARQAA